MHYAHRLEVKGPEVVKAEEEFLFWRGQLHYEHFKCRTAAAQ